MKKNIYIISIIFIILDQLTKILIVNNFTIGEELTMIKSFFSLTYVINTGGAFSIFSGSILFLILVGIIALILFDKYILEKKAYKKYELILYAMLIGGIIGNLIDRIRLGHVIDFLSFNILGYNFPVFNLADIFIVCSISLIVIITLINMKKQEEK